jgi:hypothetical protein
LAGVTGGFGVERLIVDCNGWSGQPSANGASAFADGPETVVLGMVGNSVEYKQKNLLVQATNRDLARGEDRQNNSFIHIQIALVPTERA